MSTFASVSRAVVRRRRSTPSVRPLPRPSSPSTRSVRFLTFLIWRFILLIRSLCALCLVHVNHVSHPCVQAALAEWRLFFPWLPAFHFHLFTSFCFIFVFIQIILFKSFCSHL